jgi:hypothetical protein
VLKTYDALEKTVGLPKSDPDAKSFGVPILHCKRLQFDLATGNTYKFNTERETVLFMGD